MGVRYVPGAVVRMFYGFHSNRASVALMPLWQYSQQHNARCGGGWVFVCLNLVLSTQRKFTIGYGMPLTKIYHFHFDTLPMVASYHTQAAYIPLVCSARYRRIRGTTLDQQSSRRNGWSSSACFNMLYCVLYRWNGPCKGAPSCIIWVSMGKPNGRRRAKYTRIKFIHHPRG